MTTASLIAKYESMQTDLGRLGAQVDAATLCADVIADLRRLEVAAGEVLVTLGEAALHSGYSPEHLRRLVREGRLAGHRRGRRLYLRAGDLPRKPSKVDRSSTGPYDPIADARQLSSGRATRRLCGATAKN